MMLGAVESLYGKASRGGGGCEARGGGMERKSEWGERNTGGMMGGVQATQTVGMRGERMRYMRGGAEDRGGGGGGGG